MFCYGYIQGKRLFYDWLAAVKQRSAKHGAVLLQPANRKTTVSLVYMHVNQVYIRMFYFQAVCLHFQAVCLLFPSCMFTLSNCMFTPVKLLFYSVKLLFYSGSGPFTTHPGPPPCRRSDEPPISSPPLTVTGRRSRQ